MKAPHLLLALLILAGSADLRDAHDRILTIADPDGRGVSPVRLDNLKSKWPPRTLMLATANAAATLVFVLTGMVAWAQCLPMLAGGILGGWSGALIGRRLPAGLIRAWTLLLTTVTTAVFFYRGYLA